MRPRRLLTILVLAATSLILLWFLSTGDIDPLESARENLRAAERAHGNESIEVASALDTLVESLYGAGLATSSEAVEHARRVVAIKQTILGEDDPAVAYSLGNLGAIFHARGDFGGAIDSTKRSLDILRKQKSGGPFSVLNNLAYFSTESGDFNAARLYFNEALDVLKDRPLDQHLAETQNNYALLLHETGDYEAARQLFDAALSFWESRDAAKLVHVLNNLGRLLHDEGEYELARERLERARALVERLDPPLPAVRAMVLNNLGYLLHDLGELETAAGLYEEALRLREETLGPDHPLLAWTLVNLALLQFERREAGDDVEALLKRALDIRRGALGRQHPLVFHSLTYLAALRLHQESLEEALELALEAEEIRRRGMLLEVQVLAERQALLRRSLDVFKIDATSLDVALSVVVQAAGGSEGLGTDVVVNVWDDVVRSRGLVLDELAQRHRSALATDDPQEKRLFDEVHAARQRMANLWVRTGSGELFRQAKMDKEAAEEALARAGWDPRDEADRKKTGWKEVRSSFGLLPAGSVLVAYVRYARLLPDRIAMRAPVPSYLALCHVVGDETPRIVPLGPAAEIDSLIDAWHQSILRGVLISAENAPTAMAEYREISSRLRAQIWDPLAVDRRGSSPVFVVPDGALHRVSFASLATGENEFLVEGRPIHYLTTERDLPFFLGESSEQKPHGSGLLALARPRFEPGSAEEPEAVANPCLSSFDDLPATEDEVGEILTVVREASLRAKERPVDTDALVLVGDEANEANFKKLAPGRRYLHLATHGFYLDAKCVQNQSNAKVRGLGLATVSSTRTRRDDENPLLLSGIALAGANRGAPGSEEDGILTAEEVVSMDLSGVDWAVLSACKTGVGVIHIGEGIFGLRRAFQIAGVSTLISSLWPVEDSATRKWMVALYRARFESRLSTAEAVRKASLAVLTEGRREGPFAHPFFWAAFLAAGDWR